MPPIRWNEDSEFGSSSTFTLGKWDRALVLDSQNLLKVSSQACMTPVVQESTFRSRAMIFFWSAARPVVNVVEAWASS